MSSEVRTDSEDELYTIMDGLETQAETHESKEEKADINQRVLGATGFLIASATAYLVERVPESPPSERYAMAAVALGAIIAGASENFRWQHHHIRAQDKREWLQWLHQDPDYESIEKHLERQRYSRMYGV